SCFAARETVLEKCRYAEQREPLKLALIGTHGVGKTTLAYEICSLLKKADPHVELVTEVARRSPFPINAATTLEGQLWILHAQIAPELEAGARAPPVICDRAALDNYCYLVHKFGRPPHLCSARKKTPTGPAPPGGCPRPRGSFFGWPRPTGDCGWSAQVRSAAPAGRPGRRSRSRPGQSRRESSPHSGSNPCLPSDRH